MPIRKSTIWLAAVLILAALVGRPAPVGAQCVVTNTDTGSNVAMTYMYVNKTLTAPYFCTLTMSMNVIACNLSGGAGTTNVLSASAFNTAVNPTCGWNCACGIVTIDGSDGLPVELMEFSVEDEGEAGGADAGEHDGTAGDESAS